MKIYLNGDVLEYKKSIFPAGETFIELPTADDLMATRDLTEREENNLHVEMSSSEDIVEFMLVFNVLKSYVPRAEWILNLPYVPYGRQDRHTSAGTPFSLKVVADLINSMGFTEVNVHTPHSNVTQLLINNCIVHDMVPTLNAFLWDVVGSGPFEEVVLIAPDMGAEKRTYELAKELEVPEVVTCIKKRDPATGKITGLEVPPFNVKDRHLVVVDDICDGGGTFIELAKHLPESRKSLSLFVAHGIFSKNALEKLKIAGYDKVDSQFNFIHEGLTNV